MGLDLLEEISLVIRAQPIESNLIQRSRQMKTSWPESNYLIPGVSFIR